MPSNIEFEVNSRIEIEMEDEYYKSNIQDVGNDCIGISIPVNNGTYLPLHKGDKIKCIYFDNNQMYTFNTVVVSRKIDRIFIVVIKKPTEVREYQRRNFVRVPFTKEILYSVITDDNQINFLNATSLNISGGGMKLAIDDKFGHKITYGCELIIIIPVDDKNITLKGKIVRISNNKENKKLICGISFVDVDKNTREKIIEVVFEIMREQIRKGVKGE